MDGGQARFGGRHRLDDQVDQVPDIPIGQRVRFYREAQGKSQSVVAGLASISDEYLSMIELGKKTPTIGTLHRIAQVLSVRIGELLGEPRFQLDTPQHIDAMIEMQRALTTYPSSTVPAPHDVDQLGNGVASAWMTWHTSATRFSEVAATLPGLLVQGESYVRGLGAPGDVESRRVVWRHLSDAYALAQEFTRRVGRADLNLLAADRCTRAAEDADDALRMVKGRWNMAHALLGDQQPEGTIEVCRRAIEETRPRLSDAPLEWTAMCSQLFLPIVRATARQGAGRTARELLGESASPLARQVGDRLVLWMVSGPVNVAIHAVSLEMEIGNGAEGLRLGEAIELDRALSIERKTTLLIELARCHEYRRDYAMVLHCLLRVEGLAPEDIRYHELTRTMVRNLVAQSKPAYRGDAQALAQRVGLAG